MAAKLISIEKKVQRCLLNTESEYREYGADFCGSWGVQEACSGF